MRRGAWADARGHFRAANASRESPEALEGLGWAEWWLDRPLASFAARERAYRLFQQRGDRRAAARVAMALAADTFDYLGEPAVSRGWIGRARRLLKGHERTPEYGWALLWEGHWRRVVDNDPRAAQRLGVRAAALARRLGLVDLEMLAEALQALALVDLGRIDEGMRLLDEAMTAALSGEMTALDAVGQTCCFLMHACERVCDYDRAVQWCRRIKTFCQEWHVKTLFTICRTRYAAVLVSHGEYAQAERELRAALAQRDARPAVARAAWVQLAELRRRQRRTAEARDLFEKATGHSLALLGRAALALDAGRWAEAAELADRFLRTVSGDVPMEVAAGLELLAHAVVELDRPSDAVTAARRIRTIARRLDVLPMRALVVSIDAAVARGRREGDRARSLYLDAAELFTRAGMPFEARLAAARAARAGALGEAAPAAAARREGAPALTARERDVLRLVAQGLSDRRMAERLRLSEHTVHRHVANVLVKLDVPSRSAAVARAVRDSLIDATDV